MCKSGKNSIIASNGSSINNVTNINESEVNDSLHYENSNNITDSDNFVIESVIITKARKEATKWGIISGIISSLIASYIYDLFK